MILDIRNLRHYCGITFISKISTNFCYNCIYDLKWYYVLCSSLLRFIARVFYSLVILHCHIYIVSNHLPKECILYTYSFLIHITCVLQRSNRLATNVLSNKLKV